MPNIKICVYDEKNNLIGGVQYDHIELEKYITKKGIPNRVKGSLPIGTYEMVNEAEVPFGSKGFFEAMLKAKGFDVV